MHASGVFGIAGKLRAQYPILQRGSNAGLLSGDTVINQIQGDLRQITSYQGSGAVKTLADLGITLGSDGKMTLDSSRVSGYTDAQVSSAFSFFGRFSSSPLS